MNIRNNLHIASGLLPLNQLIRLTSKKIILPFYHTISDEKLPHIHNLYSIRNRKVFEKDIDYLCQNFAPISLDELYDIILENKQLNKPVFHLSFDDGLSQVYSHISPLLEKKGIPASIFINTDFIDNKALFYRYKVSLIIDNLSSDKKQKEDISSLLNIDLQNNNQITRQLLKLRYNDISMINSIARIVNIDFEKYLSDSKPYLTSDEVIDLRNRGFSIGSHSSNHPLFKDLSFTEQKRQIIDSFRYLEERLGIQKQYFSFPFSDDGINTAFFQWLYENTNCKLSFGTSGLKEDYTKFHLHRIPFDDISQNAQSIVKTEYLFYLLKAIFNKNKINRS